MWFIGVEVEQETSAPPLKKNPGSAPGSAPEYYNRGVGGHPDPEIRGAALRVSVWSKNKGGGGPGPPGPSLRSATHTLPDSFCAGTIESPVG